MQQTLFNFKGVDYKMVETTTNKILKGDRFFRNGNTFELADSDSYKRRGIWSIDFDKTYSYGWQSEPTQITVYRN